MTLDVRRAPATSELARTAATKVERDTTNFDFRTVTLALVMVTRADLLKEYLDGGKEKDAYNVPLALNDPTKWKNLRTLFDPAMLAEMLYLFELPQTQECAQHLLTVFQTMVQLDDYDFNQCPNPNFVTKIVDYSHQQTVELDPAGVGDSSVPGRFHSKEQ
jgi:hypothetical protein